VSGQAGDARAAARRAHLADRARAYAEVAMRNAGREYPAYGLFVDTAPGSVAYGRPRDLHPLFYGSFDWHSCVEMYWVLARLLRLLPDRIDAAAVAAFLDTSLTPAAVAGELAFFARPAHGAIERPYGWAWALRLQRELDALDAAGGTAWGGTLAPLTDHLAAGLRAWLDRQALPVRSGLHGSSAFALSLACDVDLAPDRAWDPPLRHAARAAFGRWFAADTDAPARYEPSAGDFLSPSLSEAALAAALLPANAFARWLDAFLPGLGRGEPSGLFAPVAVGDTSDGAMAHWVGLNLSRAWAFERIARALGPHDPFLPRLLEAAGVHAAASLEQVVGSDYMVEHWLVAYAVLYLDAADGPGAAP